MFGKWILPIVAAVLIAASAAAADIRTLRDEAIQNVGWVAGNSHGHPIWPQMKGYVGRGGSYYKAFVSLAPPGLSRAEQQAEAHHNVRLYEKWFERGEQAAFNEAEATSRIQRVLQISEELKRAF